MQEFICNVQPGESWSVLLIIIKFYLLIIFLTYLDIFSSSDFFNNDH